MILLNMSKNLQMAFAAPAHVHEKLCLSALLILKAELSLNCLAGT
jgi:hypothetical protein